MPFSCCDLVESLVLGASSRVVGDAVDVDVVEDRTLSTPCLRRRRFFRPCCWRLGLVGSRCAVTCRQWRLLLKTLLKRSSRWMQSGDEMLFCESSSRPFASGSAPVQIWRLADFLGVSIFTVSTPKNFNRSFVCTKLRGKALISRMAVGPCRNLFNSERPVTHAKDSILSCLLTSASK